MRRKSKWRYLCALALEGGGKVSSLWGLGFGARVWRIGDPGWKVFVEEGEASDRRPSRANKIEAES
jgi:hypothetical protein